MAKPIMNGIDAFVNERERYIQANDVGEADIRELWERIKTRYPGYEAVFCYHNSDAPTGFLNGVGAVIIDDSIETRLTREAFDPSGERNAVRVTETDFDAFAAYHDKRNPGMYWTGRRLKDDLPRWGIFTLRSGGQIAGYILICISMRAANMAEIFLVDAGDAAQGEQLIAAAAEFAFASGKTEIIYMADENTAGLDAALAAGFRVTGFYRGYRVLV